MTQSDVPRRAPGHSWAKGDGWSSSCSTANQFLGQSSLCWRQSWTFPELHLKFCLNFTNWVGWNVRHWQREHRDFCVCVSKTVHHDRVRCTLRSKVSLLCLFEMGPADGVTYTQSGSNCGSGPKMCQWMSLSHQWVASLTWALCPWRDPLIVLKHSLVFWDAPPTSTFSLQLKSSAQCGRGLFPPMPLRFHLKPLPPGWGASGHWRGADGRPCRLLLHHHHHLHPPLTPPRPLQSLNTPAELAAAPPDGKRQFQHQHHVLNSLIHKTQDFNCCPTLDNLQFISVCRKGGIKVGSESDLIAETKLLSLHHWNSRMMLVPVSLSRWSYLAEVVLKLSLNLQKHYWLLWLTGVLHM